jgi:hypothetical protein
MSVIITGNTYLSAFSNTIRQQYYMSTYYSLTGESVFIEYKNPIVNNGNPNFFIDYYVTDFGDGNQYTISEPNSSISKIYNKKGTYFVSYSAVYNNGTTYSYVTREPFIIKDNWDLYNQNNIRLNEEIVLSLPYKLEQINIQPNEWGVEDIFNTAIYRLQDSLEYLISNTQTINTFAPTIYFGWFGNNAGTLASGMKWFTPSYNFQYVNRTDLATTGGTSYFTKVTDAVEFDDHLFIIDNDNLRVFKNKAIPEEIIFSNTFQLSAFLTKPISIDVNKTSEGYIAYVADQISNNVYKFNIDIVNKDINIQLFIGGFGGLIDHNNFNTPSQICYTNGNVYVLDYNNRGIKQYNGDLNWTYTYGIEEFDTDQPISIAALDNGLIYVLTENYNVYIFDNLSNNVFEKISVARADDESKLLKISFDENGDFFFILTEQNIYKYSLTGSFITTLVIPKETTVTYNNIKKGKNGTALISSPKCILKIQDILEVFRLGDGLPYQYWTKNQLKVSKNEFTSDLNYNRSLVRMAQNIKSFRDTLNAKFVIANEQIQNDIVTYFSYKPINVSERPVFSDEIELEKLGVGVNELHVPSVLNKEFKKLYTALQQLNDFLSIKNYTITNSDCLDNFCWSWNATSCYNLTLPVIKTCKINPVSFYELKLNENGNIVYASPNSGTIAWGNAKSKCCQNTSN